MRIGTLFGVLAVAGALVLTGCPDKGGAEPSGASGGAAATSASGGGASDVSTKYDHAAHASTDPELIKKVCQKFGLYDSNGMPIAAQYAKYTESMTKYTQANAEEWTKFVTENTGSGRST